MDQEMLIEPPPQKKQKPARGGHWKVNHWKVFQSLKLDIGQVLVLDGPDPQRDPREPSDAQRIALLTRLATASRSAGFDSDKKFTPEDLRRMEIDAKSAETTIEEMDEFVDWIIANESNGDFSRDAWELMDRIPIMNRRIGIIRTNAGYPCILVCGIVRDLIAQVCIYLTTYRNVIGISVPHTPDKSGLCLQNHPQHKSAELYTNNINNVAKFLKEYFDKTPITVVLDNSDGSDTEAN